MRHIGDTIKNTNYLKYLILIFVFGLIFVQLFNVFIYPSFEILSAVLILGTCLVGLVLVWIDEAIGRHNLEEANRDLKAKQAELIQSEKLAALGRLAGGVAHELNNPLTGIIGSAELMLMRLEKKDGDCSGCVSTLETVKKEGRRCQDLARNLLQFSRKKKAELKPASINEVIEDTLKILTHHLYKPGASIKVVKDLASDLPLVLADPGQIEQVIMNLAINGTDAMTDGGTITIATGVREGKVFVDVTDTGAGIPQELKSKIFEPLFTTKSEGKGTGLGLSISRDIISSHGGEIYYKSKIGEGTTFTIALPVHENH